MEKEFKFKIEDLNTQLEKLVRNGVTELTITDEKVSHSKKLILNVINLVAQKAPDLFVSILVDANVIDKDVAACATQVFCSFEIPLECSQKGDKILFDKKFYANKARLLNDFGLVFGFQLTYATKTGDTAKLFLERLDFAVNQYPNHLVFPQIENLAQLPEGFAPKVTGIFSAQDIRYCRDVSFACNTFYSAGRAVPWFLCVLKPLRIYPSRFFADFAEWQHCNNCDYKSGFNANEQKHIEIEKMQLLFLQEKYEEKNCRNLETIVHDVVCLNGAMARLCGENEECVVETSYSPDDIFSEEVLDIVAFSENVCMETCKVKLFAGEEGPDYKIQ